MELKELIPTQKVIYKIASVADLERVYRLVGKGGWQKYIGQPDPGEVSEKDMVGWKDILRSLNEQPKSPLQTEAFEDLKVFLMKSGIQESTKLFSKDGPYKLRESYSDYLSNLV